MDRLFLKSELQQSDYADADKYTNSKVRRQGRDDRAFPRFALREGGAPA
jgi:hypothetical protein